MHGKCARRMLSLRTSYLDWNQRQLRHGLEEGVFLFVMIGSDFKLRIFLRDQSRSFSDTSLGAIVLRLAHGCSALHMTQKMLSVRSKFVTARRKLLCISSSHVFKEIMLTRAKQRLEEISQRLSDSQCYQLLVVKLSDSQCYQLLASRSSSW